MSCNQCCLLISNKIHIQLLTVLLEKCFTFCQKFLADDFAQKVISSVWNRLKPHTWWIQNHNDQVEISPKWNTVSLKIHEPGRDVVSWGRRVVVVFFNWFLKFGQFTMMVEKFPFIRKAASICCVDLPFGVQSFCFSLFKVRIVGLYLITNIFTWLLWMANILGQN